MSGPGFSLGTPRSAGARPWKAGFACRLQHCWSGSSAQVFFGFGSLGHQIVQNKMTS